jgi:hypothetical protein
MKAYLAALNKMLVATGQYMQQYRRGEAFASEIRSIGSPQLASGLAGRIACANASPLQKSVQSSV